MLPIVSVSRHNAFFWSMAATFLSGGLSAIALEPVMEVVESWGLPDLFGLLSCFAVTAGLAFALLGGWVARKVMDVPQRGVVVFALTSMVGITVAVYAAMLSYTDADEYFLIPYLVASPIGALIVAVPFATLGQFARPWQVIVLATLRPTAWAALIGAVIHSDAAFEPPGLAALYIGWQMFFLGTFALSPRKA